MVNEWLHLFATKMKYNVFPKCSWEVKHSIESWKTPIMKIDLPTTMMKPEAKPKRKPKPELRKETAHLRRQCGVTAGYKRKRTEKVMEIEQAIIR